MSRVHSRLLSIVAASAATILVACQANAAPAVEPAPLVEVTAAAAVSATPTATTTATSSPTLEPTSASPPTAATVSPTPTAIATPDPTPFSTPLPAPTARPTATPEPTPTATPAPVFDREAAEAHMLSLVNAERTSRGLEPLAPDNHLKAIARAHSQDMSDRGFFGHVNPDGLTPAQRLSAAGYEFALMGENLALYDSTIGAHEGLMASPGHRENVLRKGFGHAGIGIYYESPTQIYFTQLFAD